jgi:hypothetical protein
MIYSGPLLRTPLGLRNAVLIREVNLNEKTNLGLKFGTCVLDREMSSWQRSPLREVPLYIVNRLKNIACLFIESFSRPLPPLRCLAKSPKFAHAHWVVGKWGQFQKGVAVVVMKWSRPHLPTPNAHMRKSRILLSNAMEAAAVKKIYTILDRVENFLPLFMLLLWHLFHPCSISFYQSFGYVDLLHFFACLQ